MASNKIRRFFPFALMLSQAHSSRRPYAPDHLPKARLDREWLDSGDAESPAAAVKIPVLPYGQASD